MSKNALIIFIHFIANTIVQFGLFIHTVFFHDYDTIEAIVWIIIGIVLTYVDYYACIRIIGDENISAPWIVHIADFVLAIPNIALWGYSLFLDVVNSCIIKPEKSIHDIVLISGIILVDVCHLLERISLINRNH